MNLSARSFTEPALFCTEARYVTDRESLNSWKVRQQSEAHGVGFGYSKHIPQIKIGP